MTTRDKGITLPSIGQYVDTSTISGVKVTLTPSDYTVAFAWNYGAGYIIPINAAPLTAVAPIDFVTKGQNATALAANRGGHIVHQTGIGSGGSVDGNHFFQNTAALGGGWNTSHWVLGTNFHFWVDAKNRLRTKVGAPAGDTDGNVVGLDLIASAVYDPPNLIDGAGVTTTIALAGAGLGDMVIGSFSLDIQGMTVTYYVSAANVVSIRFQNESGGAIDLASGTLNVKLIKL